MTQSNNSLGPISEEDIFTPGKQYRDDDAERLEIDEPRIMVPEDFDQVKEVE